MIKSISKYKVNEVGASMYKFISGLLELIILKLSKSLEIQGRNIFLNCIDML